MSWYFNGVHKKWKLVINSCAEWALFRGNRVPGLGASSKIRDNDTEQQGIGTSTLITAFWGFSKWSTFISCITETNKWYTWSALAPAQVPERVLHKNCWHSAHACQHLCSCCCRAHGLARKEPTKIWWRSSTSYLLLLSLPPLGHLWPRLPKPECSETQGDPRELLANYTITTSPQHNNSFFLSHPNWHQEWSSWNTSVKYCIWNLNLPWRYFNRQQWQNKQIKTHKPPLEKG